MHTVEHPHGGGRGKSKGNRNPVSPWGKPVSLLPPHYTEMHPANELDRPKVVTRLGGSTTSTSGLSRLVSATWARDGAGPSRVTSRRECNGYCTFRIPPHIVYYYRGSLAASAGACGRDVIPTVLVKHGLSPVPYSDEQARDQNVGP